MFEISDFFAKQLAKNRILKVAKTISATDYWSRGKSGKNRENRRNMSYREIYWRKN